MTLYHFGNCVALIYVPFYLTYKYAGLSEYGAFWKCVQAGGIYIFTQLVKMLILATFFPDNISEGSDIFGEFLKTTVDLADLVGIFAILSRIPGKGHNKVITAGLGWAVAEVILSRALFLWVGARGAEFDWKYIQKCLESNIALVQHIATTALVWLWSRHELKANLKPVITGLIICCSYKILFLDIIALKLLIGPWMCLLLKAAVTFVLSSLSLLLYAKMAPIIGAY